MHLEACEDAAMLLGHADAAMSATDMVRDPTEQRHYELIMEQLRASRMASSLESYLDEGAALDEADAVALALRRTANRH